MKGFLPLKGQQVYDMRNGVVLPRTREHFFQEECNGEWNPDFDANWAEAYLGSLVIDKSKSPAVWSESDRKHFDCFMTFMGHAITGENSMKVFGVFVGLKDGGKSKFQAVLDMTFGLPFVITCDDKVFIETNTSSSHNTHVIPVMKSRVAITSETSDVQRFNIPFAKRLSGGDPISYRGAGKENQLQDTPCCVGILSSNSIPDFPVTSEEHLAFIDRLAVFHFLNKFPNNPEKVAEILAHANDVFCYLLTAATKCYQGGMVFVRSAESQAALTKLVRSKNPVMSWWKDQEEYELQEKAKCKRMEMFEAYQKWCKDRGTKSEGRTTFYKEFEAMFPQLTICSKTNSYRGVLWKSSSFAAADEEEP
jgi:phage/plasmid-associated DNA primase